MTQPSPRQSLLFSRTLDGLEEWMEEVEGKLQSRAKEVRQREDGSHWKASHMAEDMF